MEKGVEALIIYSSSPSDGSVHYLTNYVTRSPTYLIFPLDGEPTMILNFYNHIPCALNMSIVRDIRWHYNDPPGAISRVLAEKRLARSRIGVVGLSNIPYRVIEGIKKILRDVELVDISRDYNDIRWVRSEEEIEWFRVSASIADNAMDTIRKSLREGLSEAEIQAEVYRRAISLGGDIWISYITSTDMMNPDAFVPWQFPRRRILKKGDVVITEISTMYYTYSTQLHRPFSVGSEPSPIYKKLFEVALECFYRVVKALRPGATTWDIIRASSIIEESGFTVYDSLVHGESGKNPEIGSESSPHVKEDFTFKENMVVVVQPQPVTKDLRAGIQLGATVVVRSGGPEILNRYPLEFVVV